MNKSKAKVKNSYIKWLSQGNFVACQKPKVFLKKQLIVGWCQIEPFRRQQNLSWQIRATWQMNASVLKKMET